ncbi:MAG: SDR family NAD(P)-dependent oxidoreductase [Acidobacteriota bacterium]
MLLHGKVALVTGASRGIGRAIVERFCEEGARVALCARDEAALERVARAIDPSLERVFYVRADACRPQEIQRAAAETARRWERITILVNNAGTSGQTPIDADSDADWERILEVNLSGAWRFVRAALPHFKPGDPGRIINISSVLGKFGVPGYAAYCASKSGLIGLTRALAQELAGRGITVNAICPGWVDTDMARAGMEHQAQRLHLGIEEVRRRALSVVPIGRMLDAAEIADLAVYLASDAAAGMTGQALSLCGGVTHA